MSCLGCKCTFCVRNIDLGSEYFTPGEIKKVSDLCYNCDDCAGIDKQNLYKRGCPRFKEAVKSIEARITAARKKLKIIRGGTQMTTEASPRARGGDPDQVAVSAYRQKAIDRLAAYEDTGLEPEEADDETV